MSNWEIVSIWKVINKLVFDDELGFIRIDSISAYINGRNGTYYIKKKDEYVELDLSSITSFKDLSNLFSQTIYSYNWHNNYRDYRYVSEYQYDEESVENVELRVHFTRFYKGDKDSSGYSRENSDSFEDTVNADNLKQFKNFWTVWTCDELPSVSGKINVDSYFKKPLFKDLQQDDKILHNNQRHIITKVYEQPNASGYMIAVKPDYDGADGDEKHLTFNDEIYDLPYIEPPASETARFNEYLNEFEISPYAFKSGQCVNVYWNKLDDAAEYIVSVYKTNNRQYRQKIYHVKDFVVGRNDGYVSIGDCIGDGYIVVVKAENRSGETIALSRGINTQDGYAYPKYWE